MRTRSGKLGMGMRRPGRLLLPGMMIAGLLVLAGCRPGSFWSPDSSRLVVESGQSLYLFALAKKSFEKLPTGPGKSLNPVWSPDGKQVAYYRLVMQGDQVTGISLAALNLQTGKERALVGKLDLPQEGKQNTFTLGASDLMMKQQLSLSWSPDGKQIAFISFVKERGALTFVPAGGGSLKRCVIPDTDVYSPTWSPDSSQVAFFAQPQGKPGIGGIPAPPGRIEVRAALAGAATSRRIWLPPAGIDLNPVPNGPQWDRDGSALGLVAEKTLAPAEGQPALPGLGMAAEVWRVPLKGTAKKVVDVPGPALFTSVSPDCRQVLFFHAPKERNDPPVVSLLSAPFGAPRSLFTMPGPPPGPDGKAPSGEEKLEVESLPIPVLSPDGKSVAVSMEEKGKPAKLWLVSTEGGKPEEFSVPAQ